MKGITAASIEVDVTPMSQDFANRLAASMERKLLGARITVLPTGALPKLKVLLVPVGAEIRQGLGPPTHYTIFGFTVAFHQALPLQNGSGQWASAITWQRLKAGFANEPYEREEIRKGVDSSVDDFVAAVRNPNPPPRAKLPAPPLVRRPVVATASSAEPTPPLRDGRMDYGRVSDSFVPAFPSGYVEGVEMTLTNEYPDGLRSMSVQRLSLQLFGPAGLASDDPAKNAVANQLYYDIAALMDTTGWPVLRCRYEGVSDPAMYWYSELPPGHAKAMAMWPASSLLRKIGAPRTACAAALKFAQ